MTIRVNAENLVNDYVDDVYGTQSIWSLANADSDRWVVRVYGPDDGYEQPFVSLLIEGIRLRQASAAKRKLTSEDVLELP